MNDDLEFYWRDPGFGGAKVYLSLTEMIAHAEVVCGDRHGIDTSRQFSVGGCEEYRKSAFIVKNADGNIKPMFPDESGTAWHWWIYSLLGGCCGVSKSLPEAQDDVGVKIREFIRDGLLNRNDWKIPNPVI